MSVWLESQDSVDVSNYQVHMTVNDTILTTEDAWVPTVNSSWIFHGENYIAVAPIREDDDNNGLFESVKFGCTLLFTDGMASVSVTDPVLLGIIKLKIRSTGTTVLNISETSKFSGRYNTFIEDAYGEEITIERQNGQVEIEGFTPAESSRITLGVSPSPAFTGQNVTITGQVIPDKPDVDVKLEQRKRYLGGYLPWITLAAVKTDQNSHYKYVHIFQETATYQLKASWDGDETHQGNMTLLEIVVEEPVRTHNLTIHSSPPGVTFTVSSEPHTTPWSGTYTENTSISLVMPKTHNGYVWSHWLEDEDTNRTKTISFDTNVTLTGVFNHIADLNEDGCVNIQDIVIVVGAFGSHPGHPRWNSIADITGPISLEPDEKVNTRDIALIARHFGETDP